MHTASPASKPKSAKELFPSSFSLRQKKNKFPSATPAYSKLDGKFALHITLVAVAQLFFLENSFEKHKILTSLEAILERFVF